MPRRKTRFLILLGIAIMALGALDARSGEPGQQPRKVSWPLNK
jgi:hypothetical protein